MFGFVTLFNCDFYPTRIYYLLKNSGQFFIHTCSTIVLTWYLTGIYALPCIQQQSCAMSDWIPWKSQLKYAFIHPLMISFVHSFIHLFIHLFIHIFIYPFIHSLIHSFMHYAFMHLFIHSFIHSFIYKFINSFIYIELRFLL